MAKKKRKKYRYIVVRCARRKSEFVTPFRHGHDDGIPFRCSMVGSDSGRQFVLQREAVLAAAIFNATNDKDARYKVFRVTRIA